MNNPWTYLIVTVLAGIFVFLFKKLYDYFQCSVHTITLTRNKYLKSIIEMGEKNTIKGMRAYLPMLTASKIDKRMGDVQNSWIKLSNRGNVEIITSALPDSLEAAIELYNLGIEIKIESNATIESSSYHLFEDLNYREAIVNHKKHNSKRTTISCYKQSCLYSALELHFLEKSKDAVKLPSYFTQLICQYDDIVKRNMLLVEYCERFDISDNLKYIIKKRINILNKMNVVLVLGRAGSGKTTFRKVLEKELEREDIPVISLSDYPFLFSQYLKERLEKDSNSHFIVKEHMGFEVADSRELVISERCLFEFMLSKMSPNKCIILEMACTDNDQLLSNMSSEIIKSLYIVHIQTPIEVAKKRLKERWEDPIVEVNGYTISIQTSDKHYLAEETFDLLYSNDSYKQLKKVCKNFISIDNSKESEKPFNNILNELIK